MVHPRMQCQEEGDHSRASGQEDFVDAVHLTPQERDQERIAAQKVDIPVSLS